MDITIETSPNSILLRISGDLRLWGREDEEQHLVRAIRSIGQQFPEYLVLSLGALQRVDSLGIGSLVRVLLECSKRNTELAVILPSGVAGEAIRRLRVFEGWPNFADEVSALKSLTRSSQLAMTA